MVGGIQAIIYYTLLVTRDSRLSPVYFWILVVITILIAASGYIINDYYDASMDKINKPGRWIAGNTLNHKMVRILYVSVVGIGSLLSIWLSLRLGLVSWLFLYPFAVIGLWVYSFKLKCCPVIGNIWVASFCAAVILIVVMPDWLLDNNRVIRNELWIYVAFAFVTTWYREVVKDLEDETGDRVAHCKTFVVRFGLFAGKIMAIALSVFLIAALVWWDSKMEIKMAAMGLLILQGAVVASMAFVWWARDQTYYHHASTIIKFVMIGGTCLLLII
jgi:4-hydroxybenzoate polyprenyltransferase